MKDGYPKSGYYCGSCVYTDEDPMTGICHTRLGDMDTANRGCTRIEILDVALGPHRWELTVRYPKGGATWGLAARSLSIGKWRKRSGGIGFDTIEG
jgi:hypothetical protein